MYRILTLIFLSVLIIGCQTAPARTSHPPAEQASFESARLAIRHNNEMLAELNGELEMYRALMAAIRSQDASRPENRSRLNEVRRLAKGVLLQISRIHSENAVHASTSASLLQNEIDRTELK